MKRDVEDLTVDELAQLLYRKKREERRQRIQRLKTEGRVVEVAGLHPPNPTPPPLLRPNASPTGALRSYSLGIDEEEAEPEAEKRPFLNLRWVANKLLLFVEIAAVIGLAAILWGLQSTQSELNQELAQVQRTESQSLALPTLTPTPIIGVVVLPGGHKPPIDGRLPEQGEAGDIPAHLIPALNAYVPPPIPTPGPEQARTIRIPAIDVDSPIVQGDDWEQLKKGVGQHIGSGQPGQTGNLVLSAHNDIYGEIFRHLDQLQPGDEIVISTERQSYTYIVREITTVKPTEVSVMAPTDFAQITLISCYPYKINTQRIIVFADLVTTSQ